MVLKQCVYSSLSAQSFENDVEMYGAQTSIEFIDYVSGFENDVEMYGAQTYWG